MNPWRTPLVLLLLAGLFGCASAPSRPTAVEPDQEPARAETAAEPATTDEAPAPVTAEPEAGAEPGPIRITLVGDIMLGGTATEFMQRHGYDYAFAGVEPELQRADVLFGNLEGPLTNGGEPAPDKQYLFRTPPAKVAPALARAGFDVVSLANNHTLDYGATGLFDTETALFDAGIRGVGAGRDAGAARRAAIVERGGHRVGFLAYSNTFPDSFWAAADEPGTAFGHRRHVEADVHALRPRVDTVVVSFHWGREATTELRPYQPMLARAAIDAGADIVAGHHPHVLQGVERYGDGIIFYSLANFTFGSYSEIARVSAIAHVTVDRDGPRAVELVPINVYNPDILFQPRPLTGEAASTVVEHLQSLAEPLGTRLADDNGRARLRLGSDTTDSQAAAVQ
ncbi:MAG: CapA family protein [Halofilum sp. (in: g-proteobacteria)]|nr:CapA family protein [Halofilum sp. (in: g-proteobacteria)]